MLSIFFSFHLQWVSGLSNIHCSSEWIIQKVILDCHVIVISFCHRTHAEFASIQRKNSEINDPRSHWTRFWSTENAGRVDGFYAKHQLSESLPSRNDFHFNKDLPMNLNSLTFAIDSATKPVRQMFLKTVLRGFCTLVQFALCSKAITQQVDWVENQDFLSDA